MDSTNSSLPFDRLAFSLSDKPVLLVEDFRQGQRTPATQVGENHQEVESTMKINSDGSVTGDINLKMIGQPAISFRSSWRHITPEQENEWLENTFSSQNKIGSATMKKDDPDHLLSEFKCSFEFNKPEFILAKGAGGFYVDPLVYTPMAVYSFLNYSKEEIAGYDVACGNGYSIERMVYEFPENMKILAKPDNLEIEENHIYFKATYEFEDNKLRVVREINDQTPGNICSAEIINKQRQTLIQHTIQIRLMGATDFVWGPHQIGIFVSGVHTSGSYFTVHSHQQQSANDKKDNNAEHSPSAVPGQSPNSTHKKGACDGCKFTKDIVKAKEFRALFRRNQLSEKASA